MGSPSPATASIRTTPVNFPCPRKMKQWLNNVYADLKSIRGRAGINVRLRQFPDSTEYNVDLPKSERPQEDDTPFKVVQVRSGGVKGVGVISNSHVFNSEDRDINEEDNSDWGLLDDDRTGDVGFIAVDDLDIGDKIFLSIELDEDQAIVSIDVEWGPVGAGSWDTFPNPIEINSDDPGNVFQQFFHQIIAEVTDPEQDPRAGLIIQKTPSIVQGDPGVRIQITQCLYTDLMMTTAHTTMDSKYPQMPLLIAVPWRTLPVTATDGSADEINDVPPPTDPGDDPMTPWQFGDPIRIQTPFQVVPVPHLGEDQIGVISNSHLFNSEDLDTYEEDNSDWGLLLDDQSGGSFSCPGVGGKIWLRIELSPTDQSIVSIGLEWGNAWAGYPDPIEINTSGDPYQIFFHQIIAEVTDPEQDPRPGFMIGDTRQVTQLLFANLMMTTAVTTQDANEPDVPLLVAIPWSVLPGTDTGGNADEIPSESNLMTPWQLGSTRTLNDYNFEMFDATDQDGPKVLILDGVVFGPNNDGGVDPDGMPSGDTYIIDGFDDGDEVWLDIVWSAVDPPVVDSVTIEFGPTTPDDTEEETFITIGNLQIDPTGRVNCRNELCGDAVIEIPPYPATDNFVLMAKGGDLIWSEVCDATCGAT